MNFKSITTTGSCTVGLIGQGVCHTLTVLSAEQVAIRYSCSLAGVG
jgi:hypothetical protein